MSSSTGRDAFYQELSFLLNLPEFTVRTRMENQLTGFTVRELKTILQVLKDRHRDIMGFNHYDLLLSGNRQQLVDRLTQFLQGQAMVTMLEQGAFGGAAPSTSSGSSAPTSRSASARASSSSARSEEEVICISSDSDEEEEADLAYDDEDEEDDEEEYEEPRRKSRLRRPAPLQQPAPPPQRPPPPPMPAHPYQPQQAGYPPIPNPALLAFLAGSGVGYMPGPGQYALGYGGFAPHGAVAGGMGMGMMMMGEPKRSTGGAVAPPPGKKARSSHEGGAGSVEVKEEKVDPYKAMNPTANEARLVSQMIAESGIPAAESLTALRASNWQIDAAIEWFVQALDLDVQEIQSLAQASIESEKVNDTYKQAERLQMDQLRYSGDVVGSNLFKESLILDERQGSQTVRLFVREHCTAAAAPPPPPSSSSCSSSAPPGSGSSEVAVPRNPMAERRNHVVRILVWEKQGLRCYKEPARAYVRQLIRRLDDALEKEGGAVARVGGGSDEARWERLLPLAVVSREADALQSCIVDYPQSNTGGVPPLFLEAQGEATDLNRDGLQLLEVVAEGKHHVQAGTAAGEAKGRRASAAIECIEVEDDD